MGASLFETERARAAIEKYAAVTHLAVGIYDRDEHLITATLDSNTLFELFSSRRQPSILGDCVRRCFAEAKAPVIVVDNGHGLAVIGAPFIDDGEVVCAAVAGYALIAHLEEREIQRLSRDSGVAFDSLWNAVRKELPLPRYRLPLYGELLRIIGETMLSEQRRSRQVEETLAQLEAADRAKDEFLAMLSHELRGPLNAIAGWSRLLRAGGLDPATVVQALETIERNTDAQITLINDLLDVSRIVAGKLRLDLQTVDLIPIVESVLVGVRELARAKDVRIETELDAAIGAVSGDGERLRQSFLNLLSNAVKFTPSRGSIAVKLQRDDSRAKFTVHDTGQGISADLLPYIFEKFRQADSSITRVNGGLGLGLTIVQHIVELHGGTVRADSKGQGQGATFTVTLPLLALPPTSAKKPEPLSRVKAASLNGVRVWVVDDNKTTLHMLRTVLEMRGASVTTIGSGDEVLRRLDENAPDVLLCDVGMPGMDGYTLIGRIRARGAERGGNVPAIAQTGYATVEDRQRALGSGFQSFMGKPLDLDELTRDIARLAAASELPPPADRVDR